MEKHKLPIWGIILIVLIPISLCGLAALAAFFFFGFSFFSAAAPAIGPIFTSPADLAVDVVFETTYPDADPGSILALQEMSSGAYTAVLTGYSLDGVTEQRLILTRRSGQEHFVQNGRSGRNGVNDDFRVATTFIDDERETLAALSGVVSSGAVREIEILWENHTERVTLIDSGQQITFLWFGTTPEGEPQPHTVRALDDAGQVISAVAIGP